MSTLRQRMIADMQTTLFLKIATVLAILGLMARFLLSILLQALLSSPSFRPNYLVYRVLGVLEEAVGDTPLIIFFVVFFLSLFQGKSEAQKQPQEKSAE